MNRIDYFKVSPELISKLRGITAELQHGVLNPQLRVLVELRVSQLNGCAYCVHVHAGEARKLGESNSRLDGLAAWKESPFFNPSEKAALAWAEALTYLSGSVSDDEAYATVTACFSEKEVVELGMVVSLTNFWNRMAGGFRKMPPTG